MRPRYVILVLVCCCVFSTGIGFAAAELSHPPEATAKPGGSASILKGIRGELEDINQDLGPTFPGSSSVTDALDAIEHNTDETCQTVKDSFTC